ncbi:MAG: hypothetical protein HY432_03105 [Candidatus Liptonbacteria bacterium]|nr:hypothetical protein [Candidatus Liptonbacteria bacterium]
MRITLGIIVILIAGVFLLYGTLDPCGILKKEVANQAGKQGAQGLYVLFGGFIERGIDTLNPIQCIAGIYKVKTEGADKALNDLLK